MMGWTKARCTVALLLVSVVASMVPAAAAEELVDRIVAAVDDDPIFLSDVERVIRLGLTEAREGESPRQLRRRVLDELIDRRLRLHEVERYGSGRISVEEVDRQVARIRERYRDEAELEAELASVGLDEEGLRHLLTQQLRVLLYIDERLRPRVFVDVDDIRTYYETEYTDEMARRGAPPKPLPEVREAIRAVLRERRLDEEIESWTAELRLAADVVDHLERTDGELPPVAKRIEEDEEL